MPQASAAVLRSKPSSTSASASIRREAPLFFSPLAALRSSEAVRSNRVIDTAAPIDAAPLKKPASSQSFTDLGILMSHSFGPLVLLIRAWELRYQTVMLPKLNVMAVNKLLGRLDGGRVIRTV